MPCVFDYFILCWSFVLCRNRHSRYVPGALEQMKHRPTSYSQTRLHSCIDTKIRTTAHKYASPPLVQVDRQTQRSWPFPPSSNLAETRRITIATRANPSKHSRRTPSSFVHASSGPPCRSVVQPCRACVMAIRDLRDTREDSGDTDNARRWFCSMLTYRIALDSHGGAQLASQMRSI